MFAVCERDEYSFRKFIHLPIPVMGNYYILFAYGVAIQIVGLTIAQQVAPGISPEVYVSKFEWFRIGFFPDKTHGVA